MRRPSGAGWQAIPKGSHGGWRRRKASGGDEYKYAVPPAPNRKPKAEPKAKRSKAERALDRLKPTEKLQKVIRTRKDGTKFEQHVYTPQQIVAASDYKFARVRSIDKQLGELIAATRPEAKAGKERTHSKAVASGLLLVLLTGMRAGGGKSPGKAGSTAGKETFGATTIERRHVRVAPGGVVHIRYQGKKDVFRDVTVTDKELASSIRVFLGGKNKGAPNDRTPLFTYGPKDAHLRRTDLAKSLKRLNDHYKVKDLRTLVAMDIATAEVKDILKGAHKLRAQVPEKPAARKRFAKALVKRVGVAVSSQLGNTPSVAISDYIDPRLIEKMLSRVGLEMYKSEGGELPQLRALYGDDVVDAWVSAYLSDEEDEIDIFGAALHKAEPEIEWSALVKAQTAPSGWSAIPGGKHGGFRKRIGNGWTYWYPHEGHTPNKLGHKDETPKGKKGLKELRGKIQAALKASPKQALDRGLHAAQHAKAEYAHAGEALKMVFGGKKAELESHHKKALLGTGIAIGAAAVLAGGSLALFPLILAKNTAIHMALSATHAALGKMFVAKEGAVVGGGVFEVAMMFIKSEKDTEEQMKHYGALILHEMANAKDELPDDAAKDAKEEPKEEEISKATKPPGGGWRPIGKKGGFRRDRGTRVDYWYPEQTTTQSKHGWERGEGGIRAAKPGGLIYVGGRRGLHRLTPDHGKNPRGFTWVQSIESGGYELVAKDVVAPAQRKVPVKKLKKRPAKAKKAPPKAPKKKAAAKKRGKRKPPPPPPPKSSRRKRLPKNPHGKYAKPFKDSRAPVGSVLEEIEGGKYRIMMTRQMDGTPRWGVHIPVNREAAFFSEFTPMIHKQARNAARLYGIRIYDPVTGGTSEGYSSIVSGAHLGLVMAVTSYTGGYPFAPNAKLAVKSYATMAAKKELGQSASISERQFRQLRGWIAAKQRASAKNKGSGEVSREAIAKEWKLKKKEAFFGNLGDYVDLVSDVTVNQGDEQVPLGEWYVKAPNGLQVGRVKKGKLALTETMSQLASGDTAVKDEDFLLQHSDEVPEHLFGSMPIGEQLQTVERVHEVLAMMPARARKLLQMRYGIDRDDVAGAEEIANALKIMPGKAKNTRRKAVAAVASAAAVAFAAAAEAKGYDTVQGLASRARIRPERHESEVVRGGGLTWGDQVARHGGQKEARMYRSAVRIGRGEEVGEILQRMKSGDASTGEVDYIEAIHREITRRDRIRDGQEHGRTLPVDPSDVRSGDFASGMTLTRPTPGGPVQELPGGGYSSPNPSPYYSPGDLGDPSIRTGGQGWYPRARAAWSGDPSMIDRDRHWQDFTLKLALFEKERHLPASLTEEQREKKLALPRGADRKWRNRNRKRSEP